MTIVYGKEPWGFRDGEFSASSATQELRITVYTQAFYYLTSLPSVAGKSSL